jgi:hypothetical protein
MEGHRWLQPHLQRLLGLVELPGSERWLARAPLVLGRWKS